MNYARQREQFGKQLREFQAIQMQIAELATKQRLPSIGGNDVYAEAGGLISYGQTNAESFRRLASYIDKILKGA